MRMKNLVMPPFNTTHVGVFKGVLDYYGIDITPAMAFSASGHAFLINIHEQLCPSGPYCWKRDRADLLARNLGLQVIDLGFFSPQNSAEDRAAVEEKLRHALAEGIPCSMCNLENQIITGYDDDGLLAAQPWPQSDFPPARLSFGSWTEFGDNFHVNFYLLKRLDPCDRKTAFLDSLDYAVDLHTSPTEYSLEGYGIGPHAYTNWANAAGQYGSSHGNWWNATVWSECRRMASEYFGEIQDACGQVSDRASELSEAYAAISESLHELSDKEMATDKKVALLEETRQKEAAAIGMVSGLASALRADETQ